MYCASPEGSVSKRSSIAATQDTKGTRPTLLYMTSAIPAKNWGRRKVRRQFVRKAQDGEDAYRQYPNRHDCQTKAQDRQLQINRTRRVQDSLLTQSTSSCSSTPELRAGTLLPCFSASPSSSAFRIGGDAGGVMRGTADMCVGWREGFSEDIARRGGSGMPASETKEGG